MDRMDSTVITQISLTTVAPQLLLTALRSTTKPLAIHSTATMDIMVDIMGMADSKVVLNCSNPRAHISHNVEVIRFTMLQVDLLQERAIMLSGNGLEGER
jgi:hypothetical protein